MTNKTQVGGDVCFTDWITFQEGVNEEIFLKPRQLCRSCLGTGFS